MPDIFDQARAAGFSENEIGEWANQQRDTWRDAGFSDQEITRAVTGLSQPGKIPEPMIERFTGNAPVKSSGAMADIGQQMIERAKIDWGDEPLGPPVADMQKLKSWGVPDLALQGIGAAYTGVQAAFRGVNAGFGALAGALGETANKLTGREDNIADWDIMLQFTAMLEGARAPIVREVPGQLGRTETVARTLPIPQDFTDAAKVMNGGKYDPTIRQGAISLFENQGLHPAELANDHLTDPNVGAALKAGQVPERYAPPPEPVQPSPHVAVEVASAPPTEAPKPIEGRALVKFDPELKITEDAIPIERPRIEATDIEPIAGAGRRGGGRLPPPPRQGMNDDDWYQGPPLARQPTKAPYFTYDDSSAFAKFYRGAIDQWQKTFQPELVSEKAMMADPRFAEYKAAVQEKKDQIIINAEQDHQYWRGQSESDRAKYLELMETPVKDRQIPSTHPEWADMLDRDKQIMSKIFKLEKEVGSPAEMWENYAPHIYQDPLQAKEWARGRAAQLGPKWFTKERTFATIREAQDAGLRLKDSSPAELISMRLLSSADMLERMRLLHDLRDMNVAVDAETAAAERAAKLKFMQKPNLPPGEVSLLDQPLRNLEDQGWVPINAPDGKQWLISPDVKALWRNAVEAKGMWANEGLPGTAFRGWMALKNAWMPIKLGLSLFHPMHILFQNMVGDIHRAMRMATRGEFGDAAREFMNVAYDPIAAAFPQLQLEGRVGREAWKIPEEMRTPYQQLLVQTMKEGGLVPGIAEELKIQGRRQWEKAIDNSQWIRGLPLGLQQVLKAIQYPMFEVWIPNLKVTSFARDAEMFLRDHPELIDDKTQRAVGLRTIAKATENRFGQMYYGTLFWDRMLKDIGIGSMISLGWNLGQVRWFVGGILGPFFRAIRNVQRAPTRTEMTAQAANTNLSTALTYVAGAMTVAGLITYASTGQMPEGMDYFLPRTGRKNPDGTPHRLTHMFYTRDIPMAKKHIEERGGNLLYGLSDMMQSKMITSPITDLARNRDYFGNNIYNENNPFYLKAKDYLLHELGDQFTPIAYSSARQALRSGGGWGEVAASGLGFGPAPAYANRDALTNRIAYLLQEQGGARSPEEAAKANERRDIRIDLLNAKRSGDQEAMRDAAQRWFKAGGSMQGMSNVMSGVDPKISMFRALSEDNQNAIMEQAGPADRETLRPYLKTNYASKIADMMVDSQKALEAGDEATSEALQAKIQELTKQWIASGHVNNEQAAKKSIAKQLMFRHAPELAGMALQPKAKRKALQPQPQPQTEEAQ